MVKDTDKRAMNDSTSSGAPPPILGTGVAAWLGGVLLFGMLLLALLARVDRARLASLEKFSETTAAGDHVYYTRPSPLPQTPVAVASLRGESLVPVDYKKLKYHGSAMRAVARDPATKLTIYESREPLSETGGEKLYFVKISASEYLKLRATK